MSYLDIARESLGQLRGETPTSNAEVSDDATRVAPMHLDHFASAGLIVRVRSEVLGTDVLFVSDDVTESKLGECSEAIYRAYELNKLARVPPDPQHLRDVRMVTEIFGGTIKDVLDSQSEVRDAAEG